MLAMSTARFSHTASVFSLSTVPRYMLHVLEHTMIYVMYKITWVALIANTPTVLQDTYIMYMIYVSCD